MVESVRFQYPVTTTVLMSIQVRTWMVGLVFPGVSSD